MNRLVRFTGRRPSVFASRRIPLSRPHLRHYVPQKSTPESLYAEYLKDIKTISDKEYRLPPPTPMSFEEFKKSLAESNSPEDWPLKPSSRATLLLEKYGNVMSALDDPEKWTTPDEIQHDLIPKMIDIAHENSKVNDSGNPVFERRLAALEVENTPEVLVARAVSELVLSTTDKWDLERIEHKLARYNGPLSRLNVAVNYFLENPSLIEDFDPDEEELPDILDWQGTQEFQGNTAYYSQPTPVDELVMHLKDRDVQYAIKHLMEPQDRIELFELMDSIVTPVFKEDMNTLNKIAAIFNKYDEDVHLVYKTQPRLPRISRLDIFKRLLPELEEEGPTEQEKEAETASAVEEIKKKRELVAAEKIAKREPWPDLMTRDPLLDSRDVLELPPTKENPFHNRVVIRNHNSIFTEALHADGFDFNNPNYEPTKTDDVEEMTNSDNNLPLTQSQIASLIRIPVLHRQAKQQTPKGKKERIVHVLIVGDGKGMVGLGFGKHADSEKANAKALADAVRNMDWVERFEDRTIWTDVRTKFGATIVIMRPRPVGFGLRCNPYLHPLLKAAGIKDISAKVWGSRNPMQVLKAALRLLHAGHAPLGMGDGIGGPGRKMHKGTGLRNKTQIERERGRKLIDLRV